jgi:hypothetical protein
MSDISTLLTQIIPLALGAAVSPTALMGIILLLSISKNPKISGFGYYLGSTILILIVVVLGIILGAGLTAVSSQPNPILAGFDLLIGILLVIFGIRRILKAQKSQRNLFSESDKHVSKLSIFVKGFSFGFIMFLINFSTTIIILEAGKQIGASSVDLMGKLMVIIVLTLITLLVCEIPILIYFLFPKKANSVLSNVNKWMQKNGHILMGIVILVIGAYLMWIGLLRLGII